MVGGGLSMPSSGPHNLQFVGRAHVKGRRKWIKHLLVTIDLLGLQLVWSTEMAYASPYLLSLGLSKAGMSAVFLAGPLSGLIVQPIIGTLADRSKSRFGRRRPIIVIGCLVCVLSLLIFGYTREVASVFSTWDTPAHSTLTIWLAVFAVYALDFAINAVMAADRALIVDVLPISQQEEANAWAARVSGAGSILGFWIGNVDLTSSIFAFLGSTQVKILSVFAASALTLCHAITIFSVEERVLLDDDQVLSSASALASGNDALDPGNALGQAKRVAGKKLKEFVDSLRDIWTTYRTLPEPIWNICKVQAFAWGGWFPILFFSTTYVAEIYADNHARDSSLNSGDASAVTLPHEADPGTRAGSRAMFLQSVFSFAMAIVLPFLVNSGSILHATASARTNGYSQGAHKVRVSQEMHEEEDEEDDDEERAAMPLDTPTLSAYYRSEYPFLDRLARRLPTLPFQWLDLTLLWSISHVAFAVLMFVTWFVGSVWSATLVLTLVGFSWAVTGWAPTALLAQEILQDTTPSVGYAKAARQSHSHNGSQHVLGRAENVGEAVQLMERPFGGVSFKIDDDEVDEDGETSPHDQKQEGRSTSRYTVTSGSSTPRRYVARTDDDGNPIHPSPLEVSKKLQALNRSPTAVTSPHNGLRDSNSLSVTPSKTLHLRHADSFDSSYESSEDGDADGQPLHHSSNVTPLASTSNIHASGGLSAQDELANHRDTALDQLEAELGMPSADKTRTADQAGAILGIANIFVVLPQFLTSFISSIVFAFMAPPAQETESTDISNATMATLIRRAAGIHVSASSNDAIGFVFRIGGISALFAAWLCWQMRKKKRASQGLYGHW